MTITKELVETVSIHSGIPSKDVFYILLDVEHRKFRQLASRIESRLLTDGQQYVLNRRGITVEDILRGTFKSEYSNFVSYLFSEWDKKLGIKLFTILSENS